VVLYTSKIAVFKYGVLRAVRFASGKSTESSKQNYEAGGIAKKQAKKRKSRHARVIPKKQQNGLRIASEVQMLPACLTACTWQKNSALAATSTETKHKNKKINRYIIPQTGGKVKMKNSEVKKMQALSIRRDDVVSDENWFQMMRDIFFGYENEVMLEKAAEQKLKEDAEAEEVCKRG
jgi:hypothetical protein